MLKDKRRIRGSSDFMLNQIAAYGSLDLPRSPAGPLAHNSHPTNYINETF